MQTASRIYEPRDRVEGGLAEQRGRVGVRRSRLAQ